MDEKIFRYDGTNQNTLDAWIRVDTPGKENERVNVNDDFGTHEWHRRKSNDNIRGDIKDGKGFSFFFARYAYSDKFKCEDESFVTNQNPNYSSFLAMIPFEDIVHFNCIKNDRGIMSKLNPRDAVLLVVDYSSSDIISATYTNKEEALVAYIENQQRSYKKFREQIQPLHESQQWLIERVNKSINTKLYDQLTKGYEQFQNFLIALKETN